ncbi:hypothetical protein ACFSSA_01400 [Luteolibacter algae]|uniref:Uncharacterized protein n=1 Tax=Luteolibacter algae TaxID=454151 RepID=A0ABW5D4T1_9BACT
MTETEPTIEAEVVEIDGIAVDPRAAADHTRQEWKDWRKWQGKVRQLDARWMPLWIVLGFILLVLVVAIGMCAAVLWLGYKFVKNILGGIASVFIPSHELQRR